MVAPILISEPLQITFAVESMILDSFKSKILFSKAPQSLFGFDLRVFTKSSIMVESVFTIFCNSELLEINPLLDGILKFGMTLSSDLPTFDHFK